MLSNSICAIIFLSSTLLHAEEKPLQGGRSPDGSFEVRVASQDSLKGYKLYIRAVKPDKPLFMLPNIGGYLNFVSALERDHAYWHSSSRFVAVTDQGTRHSRELYIVSVLGKEPTILEQPDFYQNALGQVGAVETDFASIVTPQKWDGDDLILQLYFTANQRRSYTFEIVLRLSHGQNMAPRLSLKQVKLLKEDEG